MKPNTIKYLSIILVFIILACEKKQAVKDDGLMCHDPQLTCYHFDTSEITQTNYFGKIIGTPQPNQWTLQPISEATDFDKNVFKNVYEFDGTYNPNYTEKEDFDINKYNQNCTLNDTSYFTFVCYPNPVQRSLRPDSSRVQGSCEQYFKIRTNLNVKCTFSFRVDKFGEPLGGESILMKADNNSASLTTTLENITSTGYPAPIVRDYTIYYFIYTLEGCVYFGKGNVIGC